LFFQSFWCLQHRGVYSELPFCIFVQSSNFRRFPLRSVCLLPLYVTSSFGFLVFFDAPPQTRSRKRPAFSVLCEFFFFPQIALPSTPFWIFPITDFWNSHLGTYLPSPLYAGAFLQEDRLEALLKSSFSPCHLLH